MTLKIICLEEHYGYTPLAEAVKPAMARRSAYLAGHNSRYRDDPDKPGDRPALRVIKDAFDMYAWPIERRIEDMDRAEIDMQVLSYTDMIQLAPAEQAVALASRANDHLMHAVSARPDRFAGFCTLPWQDADAAVRELERIGGARGMVGCLLAGSAGEDVLVDDARFEPVLAKLGELKLPLYIHPGPPFPAVQRLYYAGFNDDATARFSTVGWGWHDEAGMQVLRLILSGTLDRHPDLTLISGHWGELVPFYLQRLDDMLPPGATGLQRAVSQTFRDQVYITPSGMLNAPHFAFCREVLGIERMLFAVDYPPLSMNGARRWLEELPVGDEERTAFAHGNAEQLLRLA